MLVVIYCVCAVAFVPAVISIITEPWDYNLLVRLNETKQGYDFPGQLEWEARGNIVALPGRVFNANKTIGIEGDASNRINTPADRWTGHPHNRSVVPDQTFTTPCCRNWSKKGWTKVSHNEAASTSPLLDYTYLWNNEHGFPAEIWMLKGENGSIDSPTISSTIFKYNRNNVTTPISVSVVARLSIESSLTINVVHADGTVEVIGTLIGNADNSWILRQIRRQNTEIQRNTQIKFSVSAKQPKDWVSPVLIQWVSISTQSNQKTVKVAGINSIEDMKDTYYAPLTMDLNILEPDPVCLHGGEIDVTGGRCKCQPGFSGTVCEKGCGANRYGLNCGGRCFPDSDSRQCRGVFSCTKENGCQCMTGLEGKRCDQGCRPGWYGANCVQRCGRCASNDSCDKYTGKCDTGCEDGYQPPFCQKDSCGIPPSGHTDSSSPDTLFWHSAIYEKKQGIYKAVCSGSLIAARFLLSAAWCFFSESASSIKSPDRFLVLFGTEERFEFTEATLPHGIQAQSVASIHVPQLYRGKQRSHSDDIALVEIIRPVRLTVTIAPVCIDVKGEDDDELLDGDVGYVGGWGNLDKECPGCVRNGTEIEYITQSSCLNQVSESVLLGIGPEKFCGLLGLDNSPNSTFLDPSDIGSGLLYFKNGAWFVYGVKSASEPDRKQRIAGYTGVRNYAEWIATNMNDLDVKYAVKRNS